MKTFYLIGTKYTETRHHSFSRIILLFLLCFCNHVFGNNHISTNNVELAAKDAAWCWFSDPRAIYHKGEKEAIYFGYINSKGDVVAKSLNLENGEEIEYILHESLQVDDHNVPTFLFLPNGKILTFYNHHNGDIFMRKSKYPECIADWEDEVILLKGDQVNRYCYTNPVMLSAENNRIYLFGRNIIRNSSGTYTDTRMYSIYSDDYGVTWSQEVNLLYNNG